MAMKVAGRLAKRGDTPLGEHCPIDRALRVLGNRTAMLLLRELFYGATRFDALVRRVGVTEAVAAQRLRELVDNGVLAKHPYREPGQRTRYEYRLTGAGHALIPVVLGLFEWGAAHLPDGGRVTSLHDDCDARVHVVLRCERGHDVAEDDVVITDR